MTDWLVFGLGLGCAAAVPVVLWLREGRSGFRPSFEVEEPPPALVNSLDEAIAKERTRTQRAIVNPGTVFRRQGIWPDRTGPVPYHPIEEWIDR